MDFNKISKQCQLDGFTPESQADIDFHFEHCKVCQKLYKHDKELQNRFEKEELE
jgi:hypothetical protein